MIIAEKSQLMILYWILFLREKNRFPSKCVDGKSLAIKLVKTLVNKLVETLAN